MTASATAGIRSSQSGLLNLVCFLNIEVVLPRTATPKKSLDQRRFLVVGINPKLTHFERQAEFLQQPVRHAA